MKYRDLDLKKLRDECGLDFAHYTYKRVQCSCCYGPRDMAAIHWRGRKIKEDGDITYILYKNAYNGRGWVTKDDDVHDHDCISWKMPLKLLSKVCSALSTQYGEGFRVYKPKNDFYTIVVAKKDYPMKSDNCRDAYICYYENGKRHRWYYYGKPTPPCRY